jgi:aminomethyltransferase
MLRTPFYDFHVSAGAKMVDFAGWEMPLLYRGISVEHQHTRTHGSLFDVSHMGRLRCAGKDVAAFLDKVLTRSVASQNVGVSRYSLVCNERGGVMDDVIVSRDERDWLIVCNAANRTKLLDHFRPIASAMNVTIDDQTERTAMVAVQGPMVIDRLANVLPVDVKSMKRYTFETVEVMFMRLTVFRGGYTGEDGVEIILPAKAAALGIKMLGKNLAKPDATIAPAGLGARDTLRLEAGLPLYGHELTESIDPISAGLAWAIDLNKDFLGASALRRIAQKGPAQKLIGLELDGRRIARQGAQIMHKTADNPDGFSSSMPSASSAVKNSVGKEIGQVTSGTLAPTLDRSIAMAYVDAAYAIVGATYSVDLSGCPTDARVVKLPFYTREK